MTDRPRSPRGLRGAVDEPRAHRQGEMLGGRIAKALRRHRPRFEREGIGAFRLYDRDIPEVRAVVDWYEGHLVVGEYARRQTETAGDWLRVVGLMAAEAVGVPPAHVHLKRRRTRPKAGARYATTTRGGGPGRLLVRERDLRFRVNLDAYVDTGLFPDHRETRARVRAEAGDQSVLNLFAYTGTFTCAALAGGARHVTSVDLSRTYLDWAQAHLRLNHLPLERHEPVREDVFTFLGAAAARARRWSLAVVDPPSYSTTGGPEDGGFDVLRDHRDLLRSVGRVMAPGGVVWFSTNHQRFQPELEGIGLLGEETTASTVPLDYRNRRVHRSWRLVRSGRRS